MMQLAVHSFRFTAHRSPFKVLLFTVFLFSVHGLSGQQVALPTQEQKIQLERVLNDSVAGYWNCESIAWTSRPHTAVQPFVNLDLAQQFQNLPDMPASKRGNCANAVPTVLCQLGTRFSWKSIYRDANTCDLQDQRNFVFGIKPIYDISAGYDLKASSPLLTTAGGIRIGGDYKEKLGFDLRLAAGIVTLPNYQDSIAFTNGIIPGWGDRAYALDTSGKYGFQHLSGNIIWRPTPVFNLQVGRDKHFWGDGHRSLFLGDQGAAIPYIKAQTTIWKLQYTSLFTWLQDWTNSTGSKNDFRSKFASMHYLSVNFTKWLNIGIFESVVWQGTDSNRSRWFDANYLNPLVFFRPVEYSIGSSDNAMLGIAGKIRFNSNNVLYGQIILDEFYLKEIKAWKDGWWANKQGVQFGYKCYNFGQVDNFLMQTEINIVRPYTYSHGSPQQSYTHGGMPLAHPMGANFAEVIGILSYHWKGLCVTGKLVGTRFGKDNDTTNFGQNIFKSYITREKDYGNKLFQGYATNVFLAEFTASYLFNTKFPLRVELTAAARSERNVSRSIKTSYVMAGLCLPLWRPQRDY